MFDELSSEYDSFLVNGPAQVLTDELIGLDGTKKHFFKNGNERTCDWIEDRHGNRTNLAYALEVQIGGVTKKLLTSVTDPSGRGLLFYWQNLGTQQNPAYRITQVDSPLYSVTYEYNVDLNLWKVHLDATGLNRTTTYGYTTYVGQNGSESGLLSSISDPLGHSVS